MSSIDVICCKSLEKTLPILQCMRAMKMSAIHQSSNNHRPRVVKIETSCTNNKYDEAINMK